MDSPLDIRVIPLGPHMTKYHFQQPGIPAMHQMLAPDTGDPHDHPFGMDSFILFGGYREEIFRPDGSSFFVDHRKGESFFIPAKRVHRIVELFEGECWTITLPGEFVQEWGSWQFRESGAYRRTFPHPEWVLQEVPDIEVPAPAPEAHVEGDDQIFWRTVCEQLGLGVEDGLAFTRCGEKYPEWLSELSGSSTAEFADELFQRVRDGRLIDVATPSPETREEGQAEKLATCIKALKRIAGDPASDALVAKATGEDPAVWPSVREARVALSLIGVSMTCDAEASRGSPS